jgi:hypothetical protein
MTADRAGAAVVPFLTAANLLVWLEVSWALARQFA